jgi:Ser/Thr protein kinase RdoA (MazF antagonist)
MRSKVDQSVNNNHGLIHLPLELEQNFSFSVSEVIFHHKGENENYMIRSKDDEFFLLKKYRKDRKQRLGIELEVELCKYLRDQGVVVPHYQKFKDLNQTCLVDGHSFTIQKAIQGHMIYQPDKDHFYEIGKIHRSLHNLQVPTSLSSRMPKIDENTIGLSWNHLSEHKSVDRNLIEKFNQYKKLVLRQLDFSSNQLVHFDLHDGNIIYTPEGICMLDWEECGMGNGVFDLAVTMTRLVKLENPSNLINALLEGYGKVDFEQLKNATIFKLLYLASFVAKFDDILKGETLEQLLTRYLGYFERLESRDFLSR